MRAEVAQQHQGRGGQCVLLARDAGLAGMEGRCGSSKRLVPGLQQPS